MVLFTYDIPMEFQRMQNQRCGDVAFSVRVGAYCPTGFDDRARDDGPGQRASGARDVQAGGTRPWQAPALPSFWGQAASEFAHRSLAVARN